MKFEVLTHMYGLTWKVTTEIEWTTITVYFVVILNDIFFISQNVVEMDATAIIHSYKLL